MMTMRQWFCFPQASARTTVRFRTFRILVELEDGWIAFASIRQRQAPDEAFVGELAGLIAKHHDENLPLDAALDSLGANARIVDEPLESHDTWAFVTVAADVLAEEVVKRSTCATGVSMEERQALEDALASELDKGIKDFVAGLDASIVEVARATVGLRLSCYNFLAGSGPEIRRNRIQAARLFPVLIPFLLRSREATALISAIDSGLPLIDKMVTLFGVSKSTVRHLKEVPLAVVGKEWGDRPGVLMRLISDLAPERRPTGAAEWERFNAVVQQIARLSRQPVTTASGRLQLRRSAERRYAIAETAPDEVRRVSRDIDEFFERLSEVMRWELRFSNAGSREIEFAVKRATDELLTAHDIARIGKIAHRWQNAFLRAQGDFAEDREIWLGARWLSPITAPVVTGDSLVVPIVTASDLAEEGNAMQHCVASYACRCMRGESQIFSVRNHHGERMSTIETAIGIMQSTPTVEIIQNRARGNRTPSVSSALAAARLISHVQSHPDALQEYLLWRAARNSKSLTERTMLCLIKPVTAALRETLPKKWTLETLTLRARRHIHAC